MPEVTPPAQLLMRHILGAPHPVRHLLGAPHPEREGYVVIDVESDDEDDDEWLPEVSPTGYNQLFLSVQDAEKRWNVYGQNDGWRGLSRTSYFRNQKRSMARNDETRANLETKKQKTLTTMWAAVKEKVPTADDDMEDNDSSKRYKTDSH